MSELNGLVLLPRLQIQNANAISGPLSWGFPAPSAFIGFVHALQRQLQEPYRHIRLSGVGIVCHQFEPQTNQPARRSYQTFNLTRNPVGKDGKTAPIVEEGRAHLEISLLIGVEDYLEPFEGAALAEQLMRQLHRMRLAGGSPLPQRPQPRFQAQWVEWPEIYTEQQEAFRQLRRRLLPGFALLHRPDLLQTHLQQLQQQQPDSTSLGALLDLCRLNFKPLPADTENAEAAARPEQPQHIDWSVESRPGWLVPIPIGYGALSPLQPPGSVANSRDDQTPVRFVESLYSLGEWRSPLRVDQLEQLLWHHRAEPELGLYLCDHQLPATASV